ncbi:DUF2087 domain-containing protein [Plantactinospora endophytica]|uniref:DUF2087 domain-containing protein n=1 Tax=Plantactinospora endophytica TaxID=673535 RepID=A0ABQ4DTW8_9ACTN|nr:DUF2087 domain-containing protein [Plantactinospora endophytica]GIG85903.1 hypothetical protein Pen02_08390 [Plantactinospora endophytica]
MATEPISDLSPELLIGLLAEPDRLATFAAMVLGAGDPAEVAERTGLPARTVVAALRRLETGGLVETVDGRTVALVGAFKEAVRAHPPAAAEPDVELDPDRATATVLRAFVRDGRISQMPAAQGKRRLLLEHVVTTFEPGVRYSEREVNALLRAWYDDYAALRRYLVDEVLLTRRDGVYWRSGGPVDLDPGPAATDPDGIDR